jgi:hypothetical protein
MSIPLVLVTGLVLLTTVSCGSAPDAISTAPAAQSIDVVEPSPAVTLSPIPSSSVSPPKVVQTSTPRPATFPTRSPATATSTAVPTAHPSTPTSIPIVPTATAIPPTTPLLRQFLRQPQKPLRRQLLNPLLPRQTLRSFASSLTVKSQPPKQTNSSRFGTLETVRRRSVGGHSQT